MVRDLGEIMRDELIIKGEIANFLSKEPKTIPEIADSLGYRRHEVLIWVMAMWKYGILEASGQPDEEGYYQYQLNQ